MATHDLNVSRWKRLREYILRRDRYLDQVALRYGKRIEATHVHHVFPREMFPEYTYEPWNLLSVSQGTHNALHVRDTHKLTAEGFELLQRVARRNNIEIKPGLRDLLT
ncbi:HNH endonuclease [Ruminococcus sp.]|uniref:HNH endonuclease n=1 Tax=Ruminococcus sp. TaxID=41978 RepID=UPI00386A7E47